jgi:hypothetical protein
MPDQASFPALDIGVSALLTDIGMCLNSYRLSSPGLYCCTLVPVQLDENTRLCPGITLMVNHGKNRQCEPDSSFEYFVGPPNFVLDVFSGGSDLSEYEHRRACYERAGVLEFIALRDTDPVTFHWNRLINGRFTLIEHDDPGMIRSTALPGLWIPTEALIHRNWWAIMASIAQGVTRIGHHEFMNSIWHK